MEKLLNDISMIRAEKLKEIRQKGFDFNLISILGMETNERYTHSAIIAELLNPKGSHGYKKIFLEKFIETIEEIEEIEINFNTEDCKIIVEEFAGVIEHNNFSSRTFIDIVIRNKCDQEILIENKIWAVDQPYQLERTYNGAKSKDRTILYLTPFGHTYQNADFTDYKAISYKKHITEWLQKCIEISADKPLIMQSLNIYKNTVDKLTNQNIYKEMNNDIKEAILSSEETLKSAEDIARNFAELNSGFPNNFWSSMQEKMDHIPFSTTKNIGNYTYYYEIDEANGTDQVYIQIKFLDNDGNIILNDEKLNGILEKLRINYNGDENHKNTNWNIWFYADKNSRLYSAFINDLTLEEKFKILKSEEKDFDGEILKVSQRFKGILDTLDSMLQQA